MKTIIKSFMTLSVVLAAVACTKERSFDAEYAEGKVIKLTVNDNITKTAYTPGAGVALTGTENIGLWYRANTETETGRWNGMATTGQAKPVMASPSGSEYTFTIPSGAQHTEWTGILPYSAQNTFTDSQGVQMVVKLSAVQCPGANTFDPAYDYLLAKNFQVQEEAGTAQITEFVRIFTPLRVQIKGLAEGEKIYSVTIASNQTPEVPDEGEWPLLVGQFNVNCSADAGNARIVSVEYQKDAEQQPVGNICFGNAVSAVYSTGLEAVSGAWPVWYMVNPSFVFNAESKLTVTVNTADAQYVRTITIPEETALSTTQLNNITVNIKGEGYTKEDRLVLTQPFSTVAKLSDAVASDGKKYTWTNAALWDAQGTNRDAGSMLCNALNFTSRTATIPAISGYKVEKIRLYAHIVTNAKYATASSLTLAYGEGQSQVYPFNFCSTDASNPTCLYLTGGILDIECPEGVDNLAGCTLAGTGNTLVSAVAFYLVEDKKEYEEATGNDLWEEFNNGKKITIDGVEYTKDAFPGADLVDVSTDIAKMQKAGVHFVSGTWNSGSASNHLNLNEDIVVIGRYQDNPASLTAGQFKLKGSYVFSHLSLTSLNNNNAFPNNATPVSNSSIVLDKCTVNCTGGLIRDVDPTYCYEKVVINKCTITYAANSLYFVNKKSANSNTCNEFKLTDSKITSASASSMYVQGYAQPNLVITATGNTFSLSACTKLFNVPSYKSAVYSDNAGYEGETGLN